MIFQYDTVSFLSDFGYQDETVGVVKSVLREQSPQAHVIDISHEIAPFDVRAASLMLARSAAHLARGVVIVAVGTAEQNIAVEIGGGESVLIGPDNGVLAPVVALSDGARRALLLPTVRSSTCRDVFAPTAAAICNGTKFDDLGEPTSVDDLVPSLIPFAARTDRGLEADVLYIDRFGNVLLNATSEQLAGWGPRLILRKGPDAHAIAVVDSTRQLKGSALGLMIDDTGLACIALQRGSAAEMLDLDVEDAVVLVSNLA